MSQYKYDLQEHDEYIIEYLFTIDETEEMFHFLKHQENAFYEADLMYNHEIELDEENEWILRFFISSKDGQEE